MPNYSLQINSQFKPFSFERYIQPLQLYGQAYKEQEEALADLNLKASIWENMLNKEQDPELYEQYSNFANSLRKQADTLASQGLDTSSRQATLGLRNKYMSDIFPIEQAYNTRKEQTKMQMQARMQNPDLMFSRNAANTKLLDYVNNPELDYDIINGKDVTQKVFTQAQALSKELIENKNSLRKVLGGDYYEYVKQRGFTREAVLAAIMDNPKANPVLQQLVSNAVQTTGVGNWNDQDAVQRVTDYAKQGLWGAVGTQETQLVNNWRAQTNLQHANAKELQDIKHQDTMEEIGKRNEQYYVPFHSSDGNVYNYDPSLGLYRDKDGNLVETPKDAPLKPKDAWNREHNENKDKDKEDNKLSQISTKEGAEKAGYKLMRVAIRGNEGTGDWGIFEDKDDIPGGNVSSYFEKHGWFPHSKDTKGFIYTHSNASFTPNSPQDVVLDFYNTNLIQDYVRKNDNVSIDDLELPADYKEGLKTIDNYLKSQGFMQGIKDDRIKIAVTNTPEGTPEGGNYDFLIFRK